MAALIEPAHNAPAERNFAEQGAIDPRETMFGSIDHQIPPHSLKDLLDAGGWIVAWVGSELEPHEFVAGLAEFGVTTLQPSVFILKGVGQCFEDAQRSIRVFLLASPFLAQLIGIVRQPAEMTHFLLLLFRADGLVVHG